MQRYALINSLFGLNSQPIRPCNGMLRFPLHSFIVHAPQAGFRELTAMPTDSYCCKRLCCRFNMLNRPKMSQQWPANIIWAAHTAQTWVKDMHRWALPIITYFQPGLMTTQPIFHHWLQLSFIFNWWLLACIQYVTSLTMSVFIWTCIHNMSYWHFKIFTIINNWTKILIYMFVLYMHIVITSRQHRML